MKSNDFPGYRADLKQISEGLDELMSDLEDIRDDAQDALDTQGGEDVQTDIRRMDEALRLLNQAADLLSRE